MTKLIFLGTANAIPDETHENTHFALVGERQVVVVDAGTNLTTRLRQAKIDLFTVTDLILTHFHPDHVSGVPTFLINSWLLGRSQPLNIYGLDYTISRIERMMDLYNWSAWPNFYGVNFVRVAEQERASVLDTLEFNIIASPVCHMVPNIGLRIKNQATGRVVVYSSDTEPCPAVARLATGADIFIHEANGIGLGHASAAQAGQVAAQAQVQRLFLIHYPVLGVNQQPWFEEARQAFNGTITLAEDLMEVGF